MKKMKISFRRVLSTLLSLLMFFVCNPLAEAQVTIGANLPPISGTLLDLKEYNSESGGTTSGMGIMLPRVELTSPTSLEAIQNADILKPLQYTGLTVYNTSAGKVPIGLNMWDGEKWTNFSTQFENNSLKSFVKVRGPVSIEVIKIGLFSAWKRLSLTEEDFDENNEYDNVEAFEFTAKQKGIYKINVRVKASTLVDIGDSGVGIFVKRKDDATYTLLAEESATLISVSLLKTLDKSVETLVKLEAGDIIAFGVKSTLELTLLGAENSFFTICQVK